MDTTFQIALSDDEALYARCLAHCATARSRAAQKTLYALERVCVAGTVTLAKDQAVALLHLLRSDRDAEMAPVVAAMRTRLESAIALKGATK